MTLWAELATPWQACLDQAWTAHRAGSLPIGAAVVDRDQRIGGRGRNRIFESLSDAESSALFGHRLAHAEMNALLSVDHATVNLRECALYTTLEPCGLCVAAIRMVGLKDVRYAARDPVAGGLNLLGATEFMRRGQVQVRHPQRAELEGLLIAMNVAAVLWLAERFDVRPFLDAWQVAAPAAVDFGRGLFASGELRRLADDPRVTVEQALEQLASGYHRAGSADSPSRAERSPGAADARSDGDEACKGATTHTARQPMVLIVTGPPASGKPTIGRQLAAALRLPYLSKDLFKETLFDALGWQDRAWSQRLGGASMALLFRSAEALLEAGQSFALESNFYAGWDTPHLLALRQRFACQFVQVVCTAPGPTLVERYERRAHSGERHPGHTDAAALDEWLPRLLTERWDALELAGPVFVVDTADWRIGLDTLVRSIRLAVGRSASPIGEPHSSADHDTASAPG